MRKFLASVGNAKLLGKVNGVYTHIADIRTLTESTLSFSNTMEEVRAGQGAQLYGRFAHDSGMTCTLTDAMFDINYVALQVGAALKGSDADTTAIYKEPEAKTVSGGKITLSKYPQEIGSACGLDHCFVWVREKGCKADQDWKAIPVAKVSASDANYPKEITIPAAYGIADNTELCVEYFATTPGSNNRAIQVKSNFIPAELILILTTKLFAGDANAPETGKPVGEITVKIPRFSLDGTFDLSMAMSSAATMSLQGTALAVDDGTCDGSGVYAEIVEIIDDTEGGFVKNIKDVIADADQLEVNKVPVVYVMYKNGNISKIDAEYFTVASSTDGLSSSDIIKEGINYITVSNNGNYYTLNGTTILPDGSYEPVAGTDYIVSKVSL